MHILYKKKNTYLYFASYFIYLRLPQTYNKTIEKTGGEAT